MRIRPIILLSFIGLVASSQATVLTFDIDSISSGALIPNAYGDNVSAATNGAFHYGIANGTTPNVTVDYVGKGSQSDLNFWANGYNDLTNVVEYEPDGAPGYQIVLDAAAGWNVRLEGFDVGNFGGTVTIPSITVFGDGGAILSQFNNFVLNGSSAPHSSFDFTPALQGQTLTIDFDLTGLGGNSDNIGIDNISFTQVQAVPEPATMGALLIGAAAFLRRKRTAR